MGKLSLKLIVAFLCVVFVSCEPENKTSTREDREALFDYIIEKTIERESVSYPKTRTLNFNPIRDMLEFREEMIEANTQEALFEVLMKMSNVRRDRHAAVSTVEGGLEVNEEVDRSAPLIFRTDYSEPGGYFFFIGDIARDIEDHNPETMPEIGDKLVAVEGTPVEEYIEELRLYIRHSTYNNLWQNMAEAIPEQNFRLPVPLDKEEVTFELENSEGERYSVTLPYIDTDDLEWQGYFKGHGDHRYNEGFEKTISTTCYDLYEHDNRDVLLIDWYGFRGSLIEDVDELMEYARENGLLGHDVIFDGTRSRGGSNGNYLLQRLFSEPYKATFGDLKLSDLTPKFVEDRKEAYEEGRLGGTDDDGSRQIEWLTTDVMEAWERGDNFSNRVQHKCSSVDKDHDGVLEPAEITFRGDVVILLGPDGGSHLDQFAAMIIDNNLAPVVGMPAGGFSSTWEFGEELEFPISGKPVAYFEWGMGHSIRPNVDHPVDVVDKYGRYTGKMMQPDGVVLEGNPPPVDVFIPQSRENYLNYYDILLDEAMGQLGRPSF